MELGPQFFVGMGIGCGLTLFVGVVARLVWSSPTNAAAVASLSGAVATVVALVALLLSLRR